MTPYHRWTTSLTLGLILLAAHARAYDWEEFRGEDYEEPAGASGLLEVNPADGVYGVGIGDGTWLKNTPVFGDYFVSLFWNQMEDALYGNVGMTLRIMPHWAVAPFVGGGGAYNQVLSRKVEDETTTEEDARRGRSYWGGIAEAGLRLRVKGAFYELGGRYTWSSSDVKDTDYWLIRFAYGIAL
jgi:hypothetical protein